MLTKAVLSLYLDISNEAYDMVSKNVKGKDLTGQINYASIYAQSVSEYKKYYSVLEKSGTVFDKQPSGDYYLLNLPIRTKYGDITVCRVRKPDNEHKQKRLCRF